MPIQLNCNECLYKRCVSDVCTLYCACLVDNLLLCQDCYISKLPLEYFERCNKDVYCKLCNLKCHDLRCIIE